MIKINNLKKSYGPFQALDQINLSISQNQITGLMGKNGSGKSTFIKCLLNEVSYEGQILIDQVSSYNYFLKNKNETFFLGDTPHKYDYLTGLEYANFLRELRCKPFFDQSIFDELLELFGLKGFEKKLMGTYSYGMTRKLIILIGIMLKPKLFILDEPTLGLDAPSMAILKKALRIIAKKETTLIVTSHEPYFMQGLCNSFYILDKGRFIYENDNFNDSTLSLADLYLDLIDPHLKSRIDTVLVNF